MPGANEGKSIARLKLRVRVSWYMVRNEDSEDACWSRVNANARILHQSDTELGPFSRIPRLDKCLNARGDRGKKKIKGWGETWILTAIDKPVVVLVEGFCRITWADKYNRSWAFGATFVVIMKGDFTNCTNSSRKEFLKIFTLDIDSILHELGGTHRYLGFCHVLGQVGDNNLIGSTRRRSTTARARGSGKWVVCSRRAYNIPAGAVVTTSPGVPRFCRNNL